MTDKARELFEIFCTLGNVDASDMKRNDAGHYEHEEIGNLFDGFMCAWQHQQREIDRLREELAGFKCEHGKPKASYCSECWGHKQRGVIE